MDSEGAGADGGASPAQAAAQQQILGAVLDECLINSRVEVRRPTLAAAPRACRGSRAVPCGPGLTPHSSAQRPTNSPVPSPPAQVRCAGAVWLVSLLLHCGRHPQLRPLLPDVQQALSQLLGDQNELTQVGGEGRGRRGRRGRRGQGPAGWLGGDSEAATMACMHDSHVTYVPRRPRTRPARARHLMPRPLPACPHNRRWPAAAWPPCMTWQTRPPAKRCSTH